MLASYAMNAFRQTIISIVKNTLHQTNTTLKSIESAATIARHTSDITVMQQ